MAADRKVSRRYAEAIFTLARDEGRLDEVEAELLAASDLLAAVSELRTLLAHPELPREDKLRIIEEALGSRVSPEVLSFLRLLVSRQRQSALPQIVEDFAAMADEARNTIRARVASAVPLAADQANRLQARLAEMTGKRILLQLEIDPSLLAGARIWLGDHMIDGSAAGRLAELRTNLMSLRGGP